MTIAAGDFAGRYGPWAVIAGASEGTGAAYARQLAAKGISLILIARRPGPLAALLAELRQISDIDCVAAAIDLAAPDAAARVIEIIGSREVGLYISNAGADPNGARFLDRPSEIWIDLIRRNVVTVMQCCHHFAGSMRARGKGGLLLVNSYACYGGGSFLSVYAASKAFDMTLAESLWAELRPHGIDVLNLVMGMTDTPEFQRLLAAKGLTVPPGTAAPNAVAAFGLAHLAHGPVQNWGLADDEAGPAPASAAMRRARILAIDEMSGQVFGG